MRQSKVVSISLSSTPSWIFPFIIVVGAIATIATTYTLSYSEGHTPAFPYTDITHTARYSPEKYVFRVGMLWMSVVMAWNWHIVGTWLNYYQRLSNRYSNDVHSESSNSLINSSVYLGWISCVAITISSMCITSGMWRR